jgi:adenylate kinase family enzyme
MRRVLVIGCGGSGKSTLARELGERTGLPVVHLDAHYWRPGWVQTPTEEWRVAVDAMLAGDAWIMDGNYSGTLDARLARCDTVVFLDLPRRVCLGGVIGRWWRFRGTTRPDLNDGCPEQMSWEFLRWVWNYPARSRPKVLEKLAALDGSKRVVVLRSRSAIAEFLYALRR